MKKDYLKYLIIPTITSIIYAILAIKWGIYNLYANGLGSEYSFYYSVLVNTIAQQILFLPVIFVPTLIFTRAYHLTSLSLKPIIYAVVISLSSIMLSVANSFFITYVLQALHIGHSPYYETINYLKIFLSYYPVLYILITALIILVMSSIYVHANKYTEAPTTNKRIALSYASLFIVFVSVKPLTTAFFVLVFGNISPSTFFYILIAILAFSAICFTYCYTWTEEVLHVNKITTNYSVKLIGSTLLTLLLLLIISFVMHIGILKLPQFLSHLDDPKSAIKAFSILSYLLAFLSFFILLYFSQSFVYRLAHVGYYILVTIIFIITIKFSNSYGIRGYHSASIVGYLYGVVLLGVSISVFLLYVCNKLSVNLFFRNNVSTKGL